MTETKQPTKLKALTIWPFPKKVRQLLLSFNNENPNKTKQVNNCARYLTGREGITKMGSVCEPSVNLESQVFLSCLTLVSDGKEFVCNEGDPCLIPGLGSSPGEGNGSPLQYPCLENPHGQRTWWATVHGVTRVGHDLATKPPPQKNGAGQQSFTTHGLRSSA